MLKLSKFLKANTKKHIIFDLDGTVSTLNIDWSNFRTNFWDYVKELDNEIVEQLKGDQTRSITLYNEVVAKHGQEVKAKLDQFCEKYEHQWYSGHTPNTNLVTFITNNVNNHTFHVWTSNNRSTALKVLKDIGIDKLFKTIITKEDPLLSKPKPDGFYLINQSFKDEPKDFLMLGDSDNDEQAAKAAHIDFFKIINRSISS